jgi:tocopherol cyclase
VFPVDLAGDDLSASFPARPAVFEGWYFKVTLPGDGQSFALIYSIEDPLGNNKHSGIGAQVMGPDDGYLLQYSPQVRGVACPSSST